MTSETITLRATLLGQPKLIGDGVWSSIDRRLVRRQDPIFLTWTGLTGDQCTETRPKALREGGGDSGQIHGGNDKAVYVYPVEHYQLWEEELRQDSLTLGGRSFGENWRIDGVSEEDVRIGDKWEIGDAALEVSRVRTPCRTLEVYFGREYKMIKRMMNNRLCGWYLKVTRPGLVPPTGIITVHRDLHGITVAEAFANKMKLSS